MHLLSELGNHCYVIKILILFPKALKHPLAHYPHPERLSQQCTPWSSLHLVLVCLLFPRLVCFLSLSMKGVPSWRNADVCLALFRLNTTGDTLSYLRWPHAWIRTCRGPVPTCGFSGGSTGLPGGAEWSSLEYIQWLKTAWAACYHWVEMEDGANSGLEMSSQQLTGLKHSPCCCLRIDLCCPKEQDNLMVWQTASVPSPKLKNPLWYMGGA